MRTHTWLAMEVMDIIQVLEQKLKSGSPGNDILVRFIASSFVSERFIYQIHSLLYP
jgi:hypothetical protein